MHRSWPALVAVVLLLAAVLATDRLLDGGPRPVAEVVLPSEVAGPAVDETASCELADRTRRRCVVTSLAVTRPVLVDGAIVALTGSRAVGLDPEDLAVLWEAPSSSSGSPRAAGVALVMLRDGPSLVAREARDGTLRWTVPRPDRWWSSSDAEVVLTVTDEEVAAVDTSDGRVRWRHPARRGDAVTLDRDRVLVHDDDPATVDAVFDQQDGRLLDEAPAVVPSPPPTPVRAATSDGGLVAVADQAVERRDAAGGLVWRLPLSTPTIVSVDPLVVFGDGVLLRLDEPAG